MSNELVHYKERMAADADTYAKQKLTGGGNQFFSTRGGMLTLGEERMAGDQVAAVIIDSVLENGFYAQVYNPEVKLPPTCFAFTRGGPDDMAPHLESMSKDMAYFMPQNMDDAGNVYGCATCPKAAWGSADRGGGKACKNQYRLQLIPAGIYTQAPGRRDWDLEIIESPQHYASSELYTLKVPPTSIRNYERWRDQLRLQHARPMYGAIVRVAVVPHPKNQFEITFDTIELLPDALVSAIIDRNNQIIASPFTGYEPPKPEDNQPAGGGRFGANIRR